MAICRPEGLLHPPYFDPALDQVRPDQICSESKSSKPRSLIASRLYVGHRLVPCIRWRDQPAGATHGGAVIRIDRAAEEARLVGGAVDAGVRPGEFMPAAHFDKPLQEGICHGCFWVPRCK